jgi:hypothetical protein
MVLVFLNTDRYFADKMLDLGKDLTDREFWTDLKTNIQVKTPLDYMYDLMESELHCKL